MDSMTLSPAISGTSDSKTTARSTLIDSVDVRLETVLGHTTLTVAELNALAAGSIVPLTASLSDLVEVRLNGVVIGQGELVAVGDQFAVRLTTLSP